jgi:hypothetical protein
MNDSSQNGKYSGFPESPFQSQQVHGRANSHQSASQRVQDSVANNTLAQVTDSPSSQALRLEPTERPSQTEASSTEGDQDPSATPTTQQDADNQGAGLLEQPKPGATTPKPPTVPACMSDCDHKDTSLHEQLASRSHHSEPNNEDSLHEQLDSRSHHSEPAPPPNQELASGLHERPSPQTNSLEKAPTQNSSQQTDRRQSARATVTVKPVTAHHPAQASTNTSPPARALDPRTSIDSGAAEIELGLRSNLAKQHRWPWTARSKQNKTAGLT